MAAAFACSLLHFGKLKPLRERFWRRVRNRVRREGNAATTVTSVNAHATAIFFDSHERTRDTKPIRLACSLLDHASRNMQGNSIVYLVGLVVIVLAVLAFFGFR
jgi:hypothetical protein